MNDTLIIELTNKKAVKLLQDMEDLNLIKVIKHNNNTNKLNISKKYKGVFTKEDALSFNEHTQNSRKEWSNT
ncbi:MAG: hypothetical protein H6553_13985 [Chitinophagales bacterium]|nr:hypothetical protein [Chitinophagales bacterium]